MLQRLSLRFRIFLFFGLLVLGAVALAGGALFYGYGRAEPGTDPSSYLTAFLVFAFLNSGLGVGVWLLFDENVAKPIERLSADLRMRAHAGVDAPVDTSAVRYLGDLGGAVEAVSGQAQASLEDVAAGIAAETERLNSDHARLTALLTEMPIATILINPAREIVLYDGQAAEILAPIAPPRLKAALDEYFDAAAVSSACAEASDQKCEVTCTLPTRGGSIIHTARVKPLADTGHLIFIEIPEHTEPTPGARPLVFDFNLISSDAPTDIENTDLDELCFVPFDTETTGLSVKDDAIIQIGAVRILRGSCVPGEELDLFVNPGRPIPPASTKVHRIADAHVADAPPIAQAGRAFHDFAKDAVLVAHNAPFDIGLLKEAEKEIGRRWTHPVLDTVLISAVVFGVTEDHSLDALCARLAIDIPEEDRHTALGDAKVTAQALLKLLPIVKAQGLTTFGQLRAATARQAQRLYSGANT